MTALTIDQEYRWKGFGDGMGQWLSKCRLRILKPHPEQSIVIVSDLGRDTGTSITNCAEILATRIVQEYELDPACLMWVEHYPGDGSFPDEEFALVSFDWNDRRAINPDWRHISRGKLEGMLPDVRV